MHWRTIAPIFLFTLLLCGCNTYTQTTSGNDWLAGYPSSQEGHANNASDDIDARVRQAGAVEPTLRFPARIGIARIGQS